MSIAALIGAPEPALALGAVEPASSTTLSRAVCPETSAIDRRGISSCSREQLEHGVVGAPALRRRRDAHLPGVAVAADDLASARPGRDAQPQACRGLAIAPKYRFGGRLRQPRRVGVASSSTASSAASSSAAHSPRLGEQALALADRGRG